MRRTSWIPLTLAVALATTAAACGGEETEEPGAVETAAAEDVEVTGLTLGTTVGPDNRVTAETGTFRPTDTIYASVETEGVAPSVELTARWTYEDGQTVDETSRHIAPSGPEVTAFQVSKPDGWPTGDYEVVIHVDGQEAERASFSVEEGG